MLPDIQYSTYLGTDAGCTDYRKETIGFLGDSNPELGEQTGEFVLVFLWRTHCVQIHLHTVAWNTAYHMTVPNIICSFAKEQTTACNMLELSNTTICSRLPFFYTNAW